MQKLIRDADLNDMSFLQHRDKTVCFTGHRTEKFLDKPLYSDKVTICGVKTLLTLMTADAYDRGARYFITGMARGVDLWAGELLLYMKRFLPDLHIIAAVPHKDHEFSFRGSEKELLFSVADASDAVICTSERYSKWCFLARNDYMLRYSSAVLGVIHENEGGTAYTLRKARQLGIPRRIIDVQDYRRMIPMLERFPETYRMTMASQRYAFWEKNPRLLYQCGLFRED
ncbi:MAG: SLOG family protein [Ruminococcus sp.]